MLLKKAVALLILSAIFTGAFPPFVSAQVEKEKPFKGLRFKLREGAQNKPPNDVFKPTAESLTDAEADAIYRRLPPLETKSADKTEFALRAESLPPPKTGKTIPVDFTPGETSNVAPRITPDAPLEIIRAAPVGEVDIATDLSITFSQPMVGIATQKQNQETIPVKLTPEVPGKWRWLGTRTLIFDAAKRFPASTKFTATVPAGTRSVNGRALAQDYTWNFETPAPKVLVFEPDGVVQTLEPLMFATFNQKIDAAEMLKSISVRAGGRDFAVRLAEKDEIEKDSNIRWRRQSAGEDQWLAFRTIEKLPANSPVIVNFPRGLKSNEGKTTSQQDAAFGFNTFGPLALTESGCGYRDDKVCNYWNNFRFEFNNDIDEESLDKSSIVIEPPVEGLDVSVDNETIEVGGRFRPRQTYKVTVNENLRDIHGQTLGRSVSKSFAISALEASLEAGRSNDGFITLDPYGPRSYTLSTVNIKKLRVRLYQMKPEDFEQFMFYKRGVSDDFPANSPTVSDRTFTVKGAVDTETATRIDLRPALRKNFGQVVLIAESADNLADVDPIAVWIQSTQLAIDASADFEGLNVFTGELTSGKPVGGVTLTLGGTAVGTTSAEGVASVRWLDKLGSQGLLVARKGDDSAVFPATGYLDNDKTIPGDTLRWFVFDDRQMYRPGETASLKGYVRLFTAGKSADLAAFPDVSRGFNYVLRDSRSNTVKEGRGELNQFGAFDLTLDIPQNVNLGYQTLELTADASKAGNVHRHNFQVQEFRRPEFEVTAKNETRAPFFAGDSATVSVNAKYYSGGGLRSAAADWSVTSKPTTYAPPNRDDFSFGRQNLWWSEDSDDIESHSDKFKGTTDADGNHFLAIDFERSSVPRPFEITAEARVSDVNRQAFAAKTTLLVHPAELYVGLRSAKNFVQKGEKVKIESIVTDFDGKAVAGAPVEIVAETRDWVKEKDEWKEVVVSTERCAVVSTNDVAACEFMATSGGTLSVKALVTDKNDRRNETVFELWVGGGTVKPNDYVERQTVRLIADKDEYKPGDLAEILVNSEFVPAEGVLTLRRNGVVKTERFSMTESSTVLKIPVEEKYLPNIYAHVALYGADKRVYFGDERDAKLPPQPAFATGEIDLKVSTESRRLTVTAEPRENTLEPGGSTSIDVAVADQTGRAAANTEVAVVAVDESVLALTNYRVADPVAGFYQRVGAETRDAFSRESLLLASGTELLVKYGFLNSSTYEKGLENGGGFGSGNGMGSGDGDGAISFGLYDLRKSVSAPDGLSVVTMSGDESAAGMIRLRQNFSALAIFSPSVKTDANGRAVVKIDLPDNLTRYRITAVATDGARRFGKTESTLTARQRLMVRPSAPRFMNFGDKAEVPVVVQNDSDTARTVSVAIRTSNAKLTNGVGRKITIPANDRAELRFPVEVEAAGIARFQVGAVADDLADAAEFAFPVWTPATTESFATYGTINDATPIAQSVNSPGAVWPQFGGLEVTTSSTQLQTLTDAFIYLQSYPFECSEQVSSRILSVAALRDVLKAFDAKDMPTDAEIAAKMKADIARLEKLQHSDGGFNFWTNSGESFPYVTVHVAHALERARLKGFDVPPPMLAKVRGYLRTIETKFPNFYNDDSRAVVIAYARYVRALYGERDAAAIRKTLLETKIQDVPTESLGWYLNVLAGDANSANEVAAIKKALLNRVSETAGAASFTDQSFDAEYVILTSRRRVDAVVLEALVKVADKDPAIADLVPKVVRGLLGGRTQGRWSNTQENVFVLLALDQYFQTFERETPDFAARMWLGNNYAGEQIFKGRSTESKLLNVPMSYLAKSNSAQDLTLQKTGPGRLYYRIALKYAPLETKTSAADYGFEVVRTYEAVDDPADVTQNADGSWTFRAGARVRVRLQMYAPDYRYHVALVDRLPAGIEIINSSLATSESVPEDQLKVVKTGYYSTGWYDHQNLRDDRAEVFKTRLPGGVWYYTYVARATTPGQFVAPPAKAEEMYAPETFGRSKSEVINVVSSEQ